MVIQDRLEINRMEQLFVRMELCCNITGIIVKYQK